MIHPLPLPHQSLLLLPIPFPVPPKDLSWHIPARRIILCNNVYAILSLPYQELKDVFCLQLIWYYVVLVAYHLSWWQTS